MKTLFVSIALAAGAMLFGTDVEGNKAHLYEVGRAAAEQISTIIR